MSVVMQISDHVVVLEYGRKISDGNPTFVKSDPRVIAAYLGVEDEEVENVLVEVGDEDVIESLDAEPDREHGPGETSSMMAGPIVDTVGHSDPMGETVRVSRGASKAEIVDRRQAAAEAAAAASAAKAGSTKTKAAPKPAAPKTTAAAKSAAAKAAPPAAKPTAPSKSASTSKSTTASPVYGLARTVKPAAAAKPAAAKGDCTEGHRKGRACQSGAGEACRAYKDPAAAKACASQVRVTGRRKAGCFDQGGRSGDEAAQARPHLQLAGRAAWQPAGRPAGHQGHRAGQQAQAQRARHFPLRPDRSVDEGRHRHRRGLSRIRRAHRSGRLDRPGEETGGSGGQTGVSQARG